MNLLGKEAGDAAKSSFNAFAKIVFQKSLIGLIFSFAVGLATDLQLDLLAFAEKVLQFIAVVSIIGIKQAIAG